MYNVQYYNVLYDNSVPLGMLYVKRGIF